MFTPLKRFINSCLFEIECNGGEKMKKLTIVALMFTILCAIPPVSAQAMTPLNLVKQNPLSLIPTTGYDGTFVGGFGRIYKTDDSWQFEYKGYLGGAYRDQGEHRTLYGNIYDLNQQQVGTIGLITTHSFVIGKIINLEGKSIPITGFLILTKDNYFIGRIMSLVGPAHHIWGEFTPT